MESVINSAEAVSNEGILTLITVEMDGEENECLLRITSDKRIKNLIRTKSIAVQSNSWMPFNNKASKEKQKIDKDSIKVGCDQIFGNCVITPRDNLSACCGLTLEHIPEMRLGKISDGHMGNLYRSQANDFLKFWINTDGPARIIERLMGERSEDILDGVVHICQACVILHKNMDVRKELADRFEEFVPEIMTRFSIDQAAKLI